MLAGFYVEGFVCASVKCKHHILVFAEVHRSKNGEGGIRTHEGVTPTRFRVVRDQPDSATSPHALRRARSLKADEPGTCSMLQKPTALGCGRLKPQPGSGDQLPGF